MGCCRTRRISKFAATQSSTQEAAGTRYVAQRGCVSVGGALIRTHTQTHRHTHTQTQTDTHTHRHTQTDRHTDTHRQTDTQTQTDTHTHSLSLIKVSRDAGNGSTRGSRSRSLRAISFGMASSPRRLNVGARPTSTSSATSSLSVPGSTSGKPSLLAAQSDSFQSDDDEADA